MNGPLHVNQTSRGARQVWRTFSQNFKHTCEHVAGVCLCLCLTLVMMSGSPCSSPPFRVNPHGAPPFSCTWMCWKETSCSTVSIKTHSTPSIRRAISTQTQSLLLDQQPECTGMRGQAVMGFLLAEEVLHTEESVWVTGETSTQDRASL